MGRSSTRSPSGSASPPTTSPSTARCCAASSGQPQLGAREVELVNDSELVAKQLTGAYKVKHPAMKPLYEQARSALRGFDRWQITSVPRAQNARADALVNAALDGTAVDPPLNPVSPLPPGGNQLCAQ